MATQLLFKFWLIASGDDQSPQHHTALTEVTFQQKMINQR